MTIQEKIALIRAMQENARALAKYFKEKQDAESQKYYTGAYLELQSVLYILQDDEYAKQTAEIFFQDTSKD